MALALIYQGPDSSRLSLELSDDQVVIGALPSNDLVLAGDGVAPIHAILEPTEDGRYRLSDLGADQGVLVNGQAIDIEAIVGEGDTLRFGKVEVKIEDQAKAAAPPPPVVPEAEEPPTQPVKKTVLSPDEREERRSNKNVLFSPREGKISGDANVLECVAYWGDTILDIEHFHPNFEGRQYVTVGDPTKAHFIAAGAQDLERFSLAKAGKDGYKLRLAEGMTARLRRGGKAVSVDSGKFSLGRRDIAHVRYGAINYFLIFARRPRIVLPPKKLNDPFFSGLLTFFIAIYAALMLIISTVPAPDDDDLNNDIWEELVAVPTTPTLPPKPEPRPKPKVVKKPVEIKQVKTPPPKPKPPKPVKPLRPAPAKLVKKVTQPKPVEKPSKVNTGKALSPPKPAKLPAAKPGSRKPDKVASPSPRKGRPGPPGQGKKVSKNSGSGNQRPGSARKGRSERSVLGVSGVNNKKPSGVNLSRLGSGVGKISSSVTSAAVSTNFRSSAGGAGGGSGSARRTTGLGGVGTSGSLGLSGARSAARNFGGGGGGGGSFGGGGNDFGRSGRGGGATPNIRPQDAVVGGGLTQQEVQSVIFANLNQIRNCYERHLQRSPNASGKVTASFVIGPNGRVTRSSIASSSFPSSVNSCISGAIRRWPFPRPRDGKPVNVKYPFSFSPAS